jgi:hypothetical protein
MIETLDFFSNKLIQFNDQVSNELIFIFVPQINIKCLKIFPINLIEPLKF